jgi:hypothetical protein
MVRGSQSRHPILKKPITKKGWWSGSRCKSWVQFQYWKKKKGGSGEGLVKEVQEKEAADQWEAYESLKEPLKVILEKKTDKSIP